MQSWKVDLWSHKELLHKQLEYMWGHHFLINLWELIVCLIGWIICTSIVHTFLGLGLIPLRILHNMEYHCVPKWVDSFYCICCFFFLFCCFYHFFEEMKSFLLLKYFLKVWDEIFQLKNRKTKIIDLKK